jgi:hypothetical protein
MKSSKRIHVDLKKEELSKEERLILGQQAEKKILSHQRIEDGIRHWDIIKSQE